MQIKARSTRIKDVLDSANRSAKTFRYFGGLQVLWPNVNEVLWRVTEFIGGEVLDPMTQTPLLQTVLKGIKKTVSNAEKSGKVRPWNIDRDILVYFLRGACWETASVFSFDIRAGESRWDPMEESFTHWRQNTPGDISTGVVEAQPVSEADQAIRLRCVADRLLSNRDWEILDTDVPRLWSVTGEETDGDSPTAKGAGKEFGITLN